MVVVEVEGNCCCGCICGALEGSGGGENVSRGGSGGGVSLADVEDEGSTFGDTSLRVDGVWGTS